jgi:hypothetical protein
MILAVWVTYLIDMNIFICKSFLLRHHEIHVQYLMMWLYIMLLWLTDLFIRPSPGEVLWIIGTDKLANEEIR